MNAIKSPRWPGAPSPYLWRQQGAAIFESPWMATQRFMFLNDLSHARLERHKTAMGLLFDAENERPEGSNAESTSWHRHTVQTRRLFRKSTQQRWAGANPNVRFACLGDSRPIRYCPKCLEVCFHTLLFQFPIVLRCPYHNLPLLNCCQRCGQAIATLGSEPGRAQALFSCETCGVSFASPSQLTNGILFGITDGDAVFDEAHRIVAGMCAVDVTRLSGPMAMRASSSAEFARFFSHALFAVTNPGIVKPPWLLGLDSEVSVLPDVRTTAEPCPVNEDRATSQAEAITIEQRLSELRRAILTIDFELSRQVRAICGHNHPRSLGIQSESIPFSGKEYSLVMHSHDCPCCAVLCWWRAHFRTYFGFRLHLSNSASPPRLADHASWLADLLPLEQGALSGAALALFGGLAAQMWEWLSPPVDRRDIAEAMYPAVSARKALGNAGYRLRERIEQHKQGSDALDLPLLRHHFVAPELHCSLDEEGYRVSYTAVQGLGYLKSCHQLRLQGALWKCDCYMLATATATDSTQYDRWFADLATECSLRLWHELYRDQLRLLLVGDEAGRLVAAFEQPV